MAMKLRVTHSYTIMSKDDWFVGRYEAEDKVTLPDGKETAIITAKGKNLPEDKGICYEFSGDFLPYERDGKVSYTFNVESITEIVPTEEEAIIAYLSTLKGVGKVLANRIFSTFGPETFSIIEKDTAKLQRIKGISKAKAEKIQTAYITRQSARKLFEYLYPFGIKDKMVMKIHNAFGDSALSTVQENPYSILDIAQIGFKTADLIAKKAGFHCDNPDRIRAGIVEVLAQGERGGEIFGNSKYPDFMLDKYLREPLFNLLTDESTNTTGGTYLPRDILYVMTLKLLRTKVSEEDFNKYLFELHSQKKIFLAIDATLPDSDIDKIKVYRRYTAIVEYKAAKKIVSLNETPLPECDNLAKVIADKEKAAGILLSGEQRQAVVKAITSPVSIVTGGPGTGKTSILKIILSVFKHYFPSEDVLLMAPTGRAAKRMSEQTGYPAKTVHKAINVYADDDGNMVETDEMMMFTEKLIIIDETSMMGNILFNALLSHVNCGTRIVLVGDVDQLPSIEVGAVLRELIDSEALPTTKLTKTYRQANGSSIITNASRIKIGEDRLDYDKDFVFIPCETSKDVSEKVSELMPKFIEEYGENDVLCLTAYRHKTESGSNALNASLKKILSPASESDKYFESKGMRIYEGDKVMFTKNTEALTNGDIGKVNKIYKTKDSLIVTCTFDGISIPFEDDETDALELAWAMTIHKSQGSEAKCVILVTDNAHKIMLRRPLIYTGCTRAKQKLYILGQQSAIDLAIHTQDSVYRRSQLGRLLKTGKYAGGYRNKMSENGKSSSYCQQLSFI